jgi:glyoxylase-like metal-dependent hydrolase (beta-lactamase superfamily II)
MHKKPEKHTSVGDTTIFSVSDGRMVFDKTQFFDNLTIKNWSDYPEYHDSNFEMNVGSFIVKTEKNIVLIDTGLGKLDHKIDQPKRETLINEIKLAGFSVTDFDIVFMTHLHLDHVGTNMTNTSDGWKPTFPNAKYMVSKIDWSYFSNLVRHKQFEYIKEQIHPLVNIGTLELFDGEYKVTNEITTLPTPGHTPGHSSLIIASKGEKAVVLGDVAHIPPQIHETEWSPSPDHDKKLSAKSRAMVMNLVEKENALLASGHFPSPGFGNLVRVESRRLFLPTN